MGRIQSFLASLFEFEQRNNVRFTPNEKMQMINIVPSLLMSTLYGIALRVI